MKQFLTFSFWSILIFVVVDNSCDIIRHFESKHTQKQSVHFKKCMSNCPTENIDKKYCNNICLEISSEKRGDSAYMKSIIVRNRYIMSSTSIDEIERKALSYAIDECLDDICPEYLEDNGILSDNKDQTNACKTLCQ
jgi:hypothetical protein